MTTPLSVVVVLLLAAVGLNFVIVEGYIFSSVRNWLRDRPSSSLWFFLYELTTCPQCMGFWSGVVTELAARHFAHCSVMPYAPTLPAIVACGLATSVLSLFLVGVRR